MDVNDLIREITATYEKHGWQLREILVRPETRAQISLDASATPVRDSEADALWFTRPSTRGREAWELRLISETPYALFETFDSDSSAETRENKRREMETRLVEYSSG